MLTFDTGWLPVGVYGTFIDALVAFRIELSSAFCRLSRWNDALCDGGSRISDLYDRVYHVGIFMSLGVLYKYISRMLPKCAKVLKVLGLGRHEFPSFETMRLIFSTSS